MRLSQSGTLRSAGLCSPIPARTTSSVMSRKCPMWSAGRCAAVCRFRHRQAGRSASWTVVWSGSRPGRGSSYRRLDTHRQAARGELPAHRAAGAVDDALDDCCGDAPPPRFRRSASSPGPVDGNHEVGHCLFTMRLTSPTGCSTRTGHSGRGGAWFFGEGRVFTRTGVLQFPVLCQPWCGVRP